MNFQHSKNGALSASRDGCSGGGESSAGSIRTSSGSSEESLHGGGGLASLSKGPDNAVDPMMMTPEEKLSQCDSRAQALADSEQFDACIQNLVRCLALIRLVYGDGHLRLAQAHARLAKAYLQFKGWAVQAEEHASRAHHLLPFCSLSSRDEAERASILRCLLSIYLTQGSATLTLGNLVEAESCFLKAEGIVGDLQELGGVSRAEGRETEFEICTNLSRVYQRRGKPEEALARCQRALELQEGGDEPGRACSVYRDMAAIEQAEGHLDRATEHLLQAHAIALSQKPGGLEGAHIAHSLALAYSTAAEPQHSASAVHYFEESLRAYRSQLGPQDALSLSVLDDYCRLLLLTGQQERSVALQRESLALKRSTFGDLSAEVAETLQLIGGMEMTQSQMRRAHRTMKKCLEVQSVLLGPQHKKTRATERTVAMLSQAPEVCGRQKREDSLKTRPPFCAVVPSHSAGANANMSDS